MKKYLKPQIESYDIISAEGISSLGDWLAENSVDDNVEITTFTLNS